MTSRLSVCLSVSRLLSVFSVIATTTYVSCSLELPSREIMIILISSIWIIRRSCSCSCSNKEEEQSSNWTTISSSPTSPLDNLRSQSPKSFIPCEKFFTTTTYYYFYYIYYLLIHDTLIPPIELVMTQK